MSSKLENRGRLKVRADEEHLSISGSGFSIQWEKNATGSLTSLTYHGIELLVFPADFPLQPVTQAFRAPTDNDKSFGNWLAKDWSLHQMDNPRISLDSLNHEVREDGAVIVRFQTRYRYKEGMIETKFLNTVLSDGTID